MRLIDADELMREVEKAENSMEYHGQEFSYSFLSRGQEISTEWYYVEELIDHAPTADAVEVVRCKDCKHLEILNGKTVFAQCNRHDFPIISFGMIDTRTWYCADGERREDAMRGGNA